MSPHFYNDDVAPDDKRCIAPPARRKRDRFWLGMFAALVLIAGGSALYLTAGPAPVSVAFIR